MNHSMSQQQHERPGADERPGPSSPPPPHGGGCSGTGADSILRELRQREQRRAAETGDDAGRPQ